MIIDARDLAHSELEADICIVGSGPAGLVISRELSSTQASVLVLESGALGFDPDCQELNAGYVTGGSYNDLRLVRRRQVGGTVNIWNTNIGGNAAAKYVPLDPIDFESRSWLPHSGWPFGYDELAPYYHQAQVICGLGPLIYDADRWASSELAPLRLDAGLIATRVYQFGTAAPFLDACIKKLHSSECIHLVQHATVTNLAMNHDTDRVSAATIVVPGRNKAIRLQARTFVLACGAIENARLLLLATGSKRCRPGNEHDLVGRFFMEHPRDYALTLTPARNSFLEEAAFYDQHRGADGTVIMGRLALTTEILRESRLLQASATLIPTFSPPSNLTQKVKKLFLRRRRNGLGDYPRTGSGWSGRSDRIGGMRLLLNLEQAPKRDNRIVLSRERDSLGCSRVNLHWTWTKHEQAELERTRRVFAGALESAGYGSVRLEELTPDPNAHHHAGTTRMHADPRLGVVDADSRVHGVENLFVVGASVFPTAGFANPMLTIVALAARLGDRLRRTQRA